MRWVICWVNESARLVSSNGDAKRTEKVKGGLGKREKILVFNTLQGPHKTLVYPLYTNSLKGTE